MTSLREFYVSLTGQRLGIVKVHEGKIDNRSAIGLYYEVTDSAGVTTRICVGIGTQTEAIYRRLGESPLPLERVKVQAALFAILDGFDARAEELADPSPVKLLFLDGDALRSTRKRPKVSDRDLRRYIVRRLYDEYSRTTLGDPVSFEEHDQLYTGAASQDFIRCTQVLESEGYLKIKLTAPFVGPMVVPTAKLVRDVERYGAAREDVVSEEDYGAAITAWPALKAHVSALLAERARYIAASTAEELLSVFRATAPIVESIARSLLENRGSSKAYPTLGPIIGDLQSRGIGGPQLTSQLDHVLKFSRDLASHGERIPLAVLRISCENAFSLAPQLAALYE